MLNNTMAGISFIYPKFLFLLLLVPVFIIIYFFNMARNRKKAVVFSNFESIEKIGGIEIFSKNFSALYINIAIIILLVLSISGTNVYYNGKGDPYSYVIAIDNSESMSTTDIAPTRFDAAKGYADSFIDSLPTGTKIGVVSFAGDSQIISELDTSKMRVKAAIDAVDFSQDYGTNLYNAFISSSKVLENEDYKSIILIGDGQFNTIETSQALKYAQKNQIVVYTVLVGTAEGNVSEFDVVLKADESSLENLASETGGKFFRADESGNFEGTISEAAAENKNITLDLTLYLSLAAIILFSINWILYNFRFSVIP